jgi:4-aminobutyrate--pyruvate transaminase
MLNQLQSAEARDMRAVLHPQTNALKHLEVGPMVVTHGEGVRVFDNKGRAYLDSGAGLWCNALGYSSKRLAKVAYDTISTMAYFPIFRHLSHHPAIDLSEKLLEIAPVPMSKVLLQCSGSEANDSAVKIAWYYWAAMGKPQRRKIISRMGSYHGSTCVAISMTGNESYHRSFGLPFEGFLHVDCPHYFRGALHGETEEQFSERLAQRLDDLIQREGPETIAAFWADPVQGNAGALPPPSHYFEKIQRVLRKYDILFVVDEVICGFGRTGEMWGTQRFGLQPDMITCAKGLSAAMLPISALLMNDRIFEALKEESNRNGAFVHGYTYSGHPVTAAVALEVQKIYDEMDIVARVKRLEPVFLEVLTALTDHPLVENSSGCGLIGGLDLVSDTIGISPSALASKIDERARENGLLLRVVPNRIAYSPPLIAEEADLREMGERTRATLDAVLQDLN